MKKYEIKIKILIEPSYLLSAPHVTCGIDQHIFFQDNIEKVQELIIQDTVTTGTHRFFLQLTNKDDAASKKDQDMCVKIKKITFQDMEENFHYFSRYRPEYPQKWLQQQKELGKEWNDTILSDHIGWNGTYYIDFETPVYRWIHRKLNLGWLI